MRYGTIQFVSKDGEKSFSGTIGGFTRIEAFLEISRLLNQGATNIQVRTVK